MYDHARLFVRAEAALARAPGATLTQLAAGLGIHPHTVAYLIRAHAGASFSTWRAQRRLARACLLLRTRPDFSIKEIAVAAGFNSTSVFDRFLRRTCGRSPSECRRLAATESPDSTMVATDPGAESRRAAAPGSNVNSLAEASTVGGARQRCAGGTLESSIAS